MTFKISLEHFRVFERVGPVEIRPITLLTGGNSAGKSSFLAALRYMSDVDNFGASNGSFNKDPFFLGSYEQIANYRGGRSGRSKDFSFSYSGRPRLMPSNRRNEGDVTFRIVFTKRQSQPTLESITFENSRTSFTFSYSNDWKSARVLARIDDIRFNVTIDNSKLVPPEILTRNPSALSFMLDTLLRDESAPAETQATNQRVVLDLSQMLRAAITAVPRTSYVGAPVRTRPSRTYDPIEVTPQSEGTHVPSRMAQLARTNASEWSRVRKAINEFGANSSLFSDLEVRSLGRSDSDPFQINVVINGPKRNIMDVGYGVSQALPILFEMVQRPPQTLFIAQQPEVHLHPEAQAALGTLLVEEAKRMPGYLILETHSDFLIDRVRRHVREKRISPEEVSLLYFCRHGLSATIEDIRLDQDGEVQDPPDSYRSFFLKEQVENLGF